MLQLNNQKELNECANTDFKEEVELLISLWLGDTPIDSENTTESFDVYFGGGFYLVESLEDLKQIETMMPQPEQNRYLSLADNAAVFDVCEWTSSGKFVNVSLITNNSGGNTYLIPKSIAEQSPNVLTSIQLSHS